MRLTPTFLWTLWILGCLSLTGSCAKARVPWEQWYNQAERQLLNEVLAATTLERLEKSQTALETLESVQFRCRMELDLALPAVDCLSLANKAKAIKTERAHQLSSQCRKDVLHLENRQQVEALLDPSRPNTPCQKALRKRRRILIYKEGGLSE